MSRLTSILPLVMVILAASTLSTVAQQLQPRERYQLHSGDQLSVEYTYTPELNTTTTIQPDGFITLRVGGDVQLVGKTLAQAKALIEQSASDRLKNSAVVLTLLDFQHPYFVVAGEAYAPLKYDLRDNLTVLQGLMIAGGTRITGKEKQIVLIHGANTPSPEVHVLDLKNVGSQKIFEKDMALSNGDIIYVPKSKLTKTIQVFSLLNGPLNTAVYAGVR